MSKLTFLTKNIGQIKSLSQFNVYLDELLREVVHSEVVSPTPSEIEAFLNEVKNRKYINNQFFTIMKATDIEIPFHWNTENFLRSRDIQNADNFLELIHPDYATDYFQWSVAGYLLVQSNKNIVAPYKWIFRIVHPLKLKDNKYHWVQLEAMPLGFDKDKNLISHFNTYTILGKPFDTRERIGLIADIVGDAFSDEALTQNMKKMKFSRQPFALTKSQKLLLETKRSYPDFPNAAIAELLGKTKDTIDTQNKQVLAKAKQSFPSLFPDRQKRTISDVIHFVEEMGYFNLV